MQGSGDLMGLGIAQLSRSGPQRLPGGVLIAGADAGVAEQKRRQVVG